MSKLHALALTVKRPVELVDSAHLIARLRGLAQKHRDSGRGGHALGVQTAVALIERELVASRKARRQATPD